MGCATSIPAATEQGAENTAPTVTATVTTAPGKLKAVTLPAETNGQDEENGTPEPQRGTPATEAARSRKSRARRLSYVDHTAEKAHAANMNMKAAATAKAPAAEEEEEDASTDELEEAEKSAAQKSKNARRRRLSYVVDEKDPNLKANMAKQQLSPQQPATEEMTPEEAKIHAILSQQAVQPLQDLPPSGKIAYTMACISRAGREPGFKKQNQDNCFAFEKFISPGQALFGAFDGHGPEGHMVSGYVKQHLPIQLVSTLGPGCTDIPAALQTGFVDVDKAMNATSIDCEFSGSTACVAFLKGRLLNVAWVGDSRGVMGRTIANGQGLEALSMTKDHKPTAPDEKARIIASSGRVERLVDEGGQPIGPFRVWLQYAWIPGLAMSRALGDALAHQVGVSSEPEIFTQVLSPRDQFIILASDGVWEFISSQDAVDIVGKHSDVQEGCRQLVDEAFQRWLVEEEGVVDDITAVVVKFTYPD